MIRVDCRDGSRQYTDLLSAHRCPTTRTTLPYGDLAFEGSGPDGVVEIGIEVKTLGDFSASYRNHRLQRQLRGMRKRYGVSILLITGVYTDEVNEASLFSLYFQAQVLTKTVETEKDGAKWVARLYNWWQKPWDKHTSMKGLYMPEGPDEESLIPVEPSLTRRWAACLPGIGWELSGRVAKELEAPGDIALVSEMWWRGIEGVGPKKAEAIVKAIKGTK